MSPCEKACGNAIFRAGGSLVVLSPEGFSDRWHPTRAKEALCAEGRMLFLSLSPPQAARPDAATLYPVATRWAMRSSAPPRPGEKFSNDRKHFSIHWKMAKNYSNHWKKGHEGTGLQRRAWASIVNARWAFSNR